MSALAIRRFPERITRRRQDAATFNLYGEPESGAMVETVLAASVQPLKLSDADIAGGVSLVERLQVYVRESDALTAAFEDRQADSAGGIRDRGSLAALPAPAPLAHPPGAGIPAIVAPLRARETKSHHDGAARLGG